MGNVPLDGFYQQKFYLYPAPITAYFIDKDGDLAHVFLPDNCTQGPSHDYISDASQWIPTQQSEQASMNTLPIDMLALYDAQNEWWDEISDRFATSQAETQAGPGHGFYDVKAGQFVSVGFA